MPKLTPISGKKLVKLLGLCDFKLIRIRGSHYFFKNKINGNTTLVPVHGKEDLKIGLLSGILSDVDLSRKEYEELRRKV